MFMTELSFLVDLLLNHKLPKPTRDAVAARIKEVEDRYNPEGKFNQSWTTTSQLQGAGTSFPGMVDPIKGPSASQPWASTRAAMAKHESKIDAAAYEVVDAAKMMQEPKTVAIIAQTPATAVAMQSRNQAIAESIVGKVDKVTGRPRKF